VGDQGGVGVGIGPRAGQEVGLGLALGAPSLRRVAARGAATVDAIRATIRGSPVVHADETGLREDGANGYRWSFGTPAGRCVVRGGRDKEAAEAVPGPAFTGVLVTDFCAAYDRYDGPHQRCRAHPLRAIHVLVERHPADTDLRAWAAQVRAIYDRARRASGTDPAQRRRAQRQAETDLLACSRAYPDADAALVPHATLCRRIAKDLPELSTVVGDPAVPATNDAAERSVRPVVIQRKISGGTRSSAGTTTFTRLATLFGTWRARGLDPLPACHRLLLTQP
jgi:transposase